MKGPLRVGLVGASYGAATHLPTYLDLPDVEVVAVATAHHDTASAIAAKYDVSKAYAGFEALCDDPEVDLVDVSTRPSRHFEMLSYALSRGKHVLSEAPLALTAAEGKTLVELARDAQRLAIVDMQSRFSPGLWEMRRLVQDGWLGQVENVSARAFYPTFTRPDAVASSVWCADADYGASTLRVHGLHTANVVEWLFGELTDINSATSTNRAVWPSEGGDVVATSLDSVAFTGRFTDGGVFSQHTSWVAWHGEGWRLSAYGSEGVLLAEAAGHTGHYPVTLSGARSDDERVRTLAPSENVFDVPQIGSSKPTFAFARLARRVARVLLEHDGDFDSQRRVATELDLPGFDEGLRMLQLAERIETG